MAFILSDRVKESTSTTGTGTYTLGGASTGFEAFSSIGDGNTTYYCCTDGTDFEVGIGTYTASGTTLARTTILQSSNSDNAVNWSAGTREIFCTLPAEKSVVIDNNNNISLISGSTISDAGNFALDVDGNITLDANGGTISFQDNGLDFLNIKQNAGNAIIKPNQTNKSIVFQRTNGDEVARVSNASRFDIKQNKLAIEGIQVTATGDELNYLDITTLGTVEASKAVTADANGDVKFSDLDVLSFGTGADLKIFHNPNHSVIQEQGSGNLFIDASNLTLRNGGGSANYATFTDGGAAELNHNGTKQFETTSTGASIRADEDDVGLVVGKAHIGHTVHNDWAAFAHYDKRDASGSYALLQNASGRTILNAAAGQDLNIRRNNLDIAKFETNGDLSLFYNLNITSTDAGASSAPLLELYRHSASPAASDFLGRIDFYGEDDNDDKVRYASITSSIMQPTNGNERGRLELDIMQNGSMITFLEMSANTIHLNKPTNISNTLNIVSTVDGGPILTLRSNDPSDVADFNTEGIIKYTAENSANEEITYAQVKLLTDDVTDGTEDGRLVHSVMKNGTLTDILHMTSTDFMLMNTTPLVWYQPHGTSFITTLNVTSPTAHRSILLPDASGTVLLNAGNQTLTGDLTFPDNEKAIFGTGGDLEIYHDTSASNIINTTGDLIIADTSGDVRIQGKYGENSIVANNDGSVELYYDNVKKFETTASGAKISGSTGDAVLLLEADTGNNDEADNAYIEFSQDGGGVSAKSGIGVDGNNRYNIHTTTGSGTTYFDIHGGEETRLYYGTNVKLETLTNGASVNGTLYVNPTLAVQSSSGFASIEVGGPSGAFIDLKSPNSDDYDFRLITYGTSGVLATDDLHLKNKAQNKDYLDATDAGAVNIYYDNVKKFETTSTGATVSGDLTLTKSSGDTKLYIEADSDNDTEGDNAFIIFKQDGGLETSAVWTGNFGGSNDNALNLTNSGQYGGGIRFGTTATNGAWETATERMRIDRHGDITTFGTNGNIVFDYSADTLNFDDNMFAKFGDSGDLRIWHSGTNSFIQEGGTGDLYIQSATVNITDTSSTPSGKFIDGGAVELYHNGNKKFETRSGGVTITGNLQFAETHGSDGNTQIFTEQSVSSQTTLVLQTGDDATTNNEDDVRIRHRNYGNATPQDLEMAIFKRNVSDNSKADITFNGDVTLLSTDAGASAAPTLSLYRNSASPANSDDIGQIEFQGENDNDEKITFGRIDVKNSGVADGAEYGQMDFMVMHNGSEMMPFRLSFNLVQFYRDLYIGAAYKIQFEGNAYNDFETSLTVAGPTADRTITLPDATGTVLLDTGNQTLTGHFLPGADDTYDLGSSSKQWRDIYTGDINLNNTKRRDNEVDGTRGSWTIQEGADDLFLINRVSGKKYKFKLEEIK